MRAFQKLRKYVHRQHKDPDTNIIGVSQYLSGKRPDPVLFSTTRTLFTYIVYLKIYIRLIRMANVLYKIKAHWRGKRQGIREPGDRRQWHPLQGEDLPAADLQHRFALQNFLQFWHFASNPIISIYYVKSAYSSPIVYPIIWLSNFNIFRPNGYLLKARPHLSYFSIIFTYCKTDKLLLDMFLSP